MELSKVGTSGWMPLSLLFICVDYSFASSTVDETGIPPLLLVN